MNQLIHWSTEYNSNANTTSITTVTITATIIANIKNQLILIFFIYL